MEERRPRIKDTTVLQYCTSTYKKLSNTLQTKIFVLFSFEFFSFKYYCTITRQYKIISTQTSEFKDFKMTRNLMGLTHVTLLQLLMSHFIYS